MVKLQDLFTQARRTQSGGGMGFRGKSREESKAHAAALIVAFSQVNSGGAEAALKAGADGLLYTWDGESTLQELKQEIESAKAVKDQTVSGLYITGGWEDLTRESFDKITETGFNYIILPFNAPARLLTQEDKDLERIVTVPMRKGELYPAFVRNLNAFENISAVELDFDLDKRLGDLSIEEALNYRAVREALRQPALIKVKQGLAETEAYALRAIGIQGLILTVSDHSATTVQHIKDLRELLEKIHKEEKDNEGPLRIKP